MPWDLKPLNGRGWILSDYSSGKREPSCASSTLVLKMGSGLEKRKKNTNIFVAVLELSGVKSSTWSISKKSIFGLKMNLEDKKPSEKVNQQDYFGNS